MKKQLFTLILAGTTAIVMAQSIPNGGFENWMVNNYEIPQFYNTSSFNNINGSTIAPYNAVQTPNAYHGSYAIQLNTVATGSNVAFAFVANGQPAGGVSVPQGGVPYNQKATGIRFYYKSTIMSGDTALVIVQFKKAHSLLGAYLVKIHSTQSSYTLFSSTFNPALAVAPDSVLFAAASSNVLSGNFAGIAGNMLQLDSVSFTGVSSQPTDMNGDFELWNPHVNYLLPGWQIPNSAAVAKQTTDKYSGSYALELTTNSDPNNNGQVNIGYATTGNNSGNGGGYPYTKQSDTLVFYYKYAPAPGSNDTAALSAQTKLAGNAIGGAYTYLTASASYKMVKVPLISSSVPDSLIINIQSSKNYPVSTSNVGSDLKIDNMYLMSSPLGIKITDNDNAIAIQPNPSSGVFSLNIKGFAAMKMEKIEIYDAAGNTVETRVYDDGFGKSIDNFDISSLNAGVYIVHVTTNAGIYYKKLTKLK